MIFTETKDIRLVTIRRGGTLTDENHRLLAIWAATCAEHVLHFFEEEQPNDNRPRQALEILHQWINGQAKMSQSRAAGGHAMAAARDLKGTARYAAFAAGQAAVTAHVAAHDLGAAAYSIKAVIAASTEDNKIEEAKKECLWQREKLPEEVRELVINDQELRNHVCWNVFSC